VAGSRSRCAAQEIDPHGDLEAAARRFAGAPPLAVLEWAAARFAPRLALSTAFGAEGCVLIDLVARHRLAVDLLTLDTGLLFPETVDLWRRLEARYGVSVRAVRPALDLERQAEAHGEALWERDPGRCCGLRKIEPLRRELARHDAWVTAIRREQTPQRAAARTVEWDASFGLVKVNPLLGWSAADVWTYVRVHSVPTNPLHERGYPSIGCRPCTSPVLAGEDPRAGRWRGRGKTECGLHLRPPASEAASAAGGRP
jgi:phosphoadenylyl-sulfate reductase (thioredoxin)